MRQGPHLPDEPSCVVNAAKEHFSPVALIESQFQPTSSTGQIPPRRAWARSTDCNERIRAVVEIPVAVAEAGTAPVGFRYGLPHLGVGAESHNVLGKNLELRRDRCAMRDEDFHEVLSLHIKGFAIYLELGVFSAVLPLITKFDYGASGYGDIVFSSCTNPVPSCLVRNRNPSFFFVRADILSQNAEVLFIMVALISSCTSAP